MRPILYGDLSAAARALLAAPPHHRYRLCNRLLAEVELADRYVSATGRLHPMFGNGSLMAAARRRQLADEPGFDNVQYCQCFEMVLQALVRFQVNRPRS